MKIIKMLCKVLMFPFVLSLILFTAMMKFLFSVGLFLLTAASVVFVVLGIAVFFTPTPLGGAGVLFLAFLLSPFGLQAVADFLKRTCGFLVIRFFYWCCIIILDTSASRIYKKISGMEVVKWHRKKFMTRNLKFRL